MDERMRSLALSKIAKKKTMRKQMYGPMTKYVVRPTRKEYDLG